MIYNKSNLFYMKMFNNTKGKSEEEVTGLLEQLNEEARDKLGKMLIRFYNRKKSS